MNRKAAPAEPSNDGLAQDGQHNEHLLQGVDSIDSFLEAEVNGEAVEIGSKSQSTGKPLIRSGGKFAKRQPFARRRFEKPPQHKIPIETPKEYHQLWPLDEEQGEGLVYIIEVKHQDEEQNKEYVVLNEVVEEATSRCEQDDTTFYKFTLKGEGFLGEVRLVEVHPWVTRNKDWGLWRVRCPIRYEDGTFEPKSSKTYQQARESIEDYAGRWVHRVYDKKKEGWQTIPAPSGELWKPPVWDSLLTSGNWDAILEKAFEGRVIRSLDEDIVKWKVGLLE
jgi:uncharacterized protein YrzB (UPF0473 family)